VKLAYFARKYGFPIVVEAFFEDLIPSVSEIERSVSREDKGELVGIHFYYLGMGLLKLWLRDWFFRE
jgi:hypothetical protein